MNKNILAAGIVALMATPALAEVPGPLVSSEWLAMNAGDVVLLDIRKDTATYMDNGHIDGAILVDYNTIPGSKDVGDVTLKHMAPAARAFSAVMQASGVSNDSTIVIATRGENANHATLSTYVYWLLKYYGHDDVAILNGGTAQWSADGRPLSDDFADDVAPGTFVAGAPRADMIATTDQVAMASSTGSVPLFDARGENQYTGEKVSGFVSAGGHIPGAELASISAFVSKDGPASFASASKVKSALGALGATDGEVIAYCNSGQFSSGLWFLIHEVAGNDQARLYDGSMHAWSHLGNPTETE